jgi:aminopeptidase N
MSDGQSGAERAIQQSIDQAKNNVNWMKQNYQNVLDWLQSIY